MGAVEYRSRRGAPERVLGPNPSSDRTPLRRRCHHPTMSSTTHQGFTMGHDTRAEVFREAVTMILYVSVVEIAELAAIPEEHFGDGKVTGAVGGQLLAIVWGTAVGLAIAHWFAFRLAAPAFRGDRPTRLDTYAGLASVAGAIFVAAVSSIPVLVFSDVRAQEMTGDVPALLIGIVGYLLARHTGRSRVTALFYGVTALALGVLVAVVKTLVTAH